MSEKVVTSLITYLEEYSVRNNQRRPSYTFTSHDEACKKVCSVTYCKETVTGRGSSKRKAKRAAAKNLMHLLCTKSDSARLELLPIVHLVDKMTSKKNPLHKNNFVGQLFDYCRNNILSPPSYEIQELDPFKFQAECTVDKVQELVIGPTKKRAKQKAAKMALEAIQLRQSKWIENVQLGVSTSDWLPDWWQISVNDLLSYCSKNQLPEPTFREVAMRSPDTKGVKCTIYNVEKLGTGLTLTGAKMAAARLMYQTIRLGQTTGNVGILFSETTKEELPTEKEQNPTKISVDNHIGQLYQYCAKNDLPSPSFKVTGHNWNIYRFSKFRVRCNVGSINIVAAGRRKKLAKQAAAKKMLDIVRPIDKNETKEIADDADATLRDDDMVSDNSQQSTQPDDLQVEENETKKITEEAVVSLRIDGVGSNDSEQSTQHDDLQVDENETKGIAEEAALIYRDDGIGSSDSEQSTQHDDLQVEKNETKEITEEPVLISRDVGITSIDNDQSVWHNAIQFSEIEALEFRYDSTVTPVRSPIRSPVRRNPGNFL